MMPRTGLLALVLVTGCAATSAPTVLRQKATGVYMGHSDSGDLIIAASHYAAMNGLAVTDADLGLAPRQGTDDGRMLCQREVLTGSHVPHWTCRYIDETEMAQKMAQNEFMAPVFSPNAATQGGQTIYTTGLAGPGTRTQPH